MAKYVPSPRDWVREQVELYENSGGTKGTTLRDTGLPVVLVTHWGNKTGAIRKTPLMRVKDGDNYILVGSQGGAPKDPAWAHNLRVNPHIELRDQTIVRPMRVREVKDAAERARLWTLAVAAYPPYADYQARTERQNSGLRRRAVIHPISVQQPKRTQSRGGQQPPTKVRNDKPQNGKATGQ
jgi:F420H(2)-dependent quinone reductase